MKKKLVSAALIVTAAAMMMSGCQTKETEKTNANTKTDANTKTESAIRVGWWGNQVRNDKTVAAIELYKELNPDVKIDYEFSDWGGYWDKLSTQAAGGTMPDVIQHDYSRIAQYVSSGQLLDLTPYVESGALDISNVSKSVLESGMIDGKLYGVCLGVNSPIMAYDKEIVEKAGVTISLQPTFEELYDISAEIYEKTGVKTLWDGGMVMMSIIARAEGKLIDDSLEAEDVELFEKHYEYLQKFSEAEWAVKPDILTEKNPDVVETKPIIDQTTWNDFTFSNMFIGVQNAAGRELEMVMYPQEKDASNQSMYLKPSMFFAIAQNSQYKDEAVKFLNWFINDIDCNKILLAERGIPVSSNVAQVIKGEVDENTVKVFDYIAEVEKIATTVDPPSRPGFSEVEAYNKLIVETIRYGDMDAKRAAAEFSAQAKKILNQTK